jgi:hypothetical protein
MWSIGVVLAELLLCEDLFSARVHQKDPMKVLDGIFDLLGFPDD